MSIQQEIEQWDGKSANDIGEIYSRYCHESSFASTIVKLTSDTSLQKGATWMLKRHLENKIELGKSETSTICRNLENMRCWESRLHILQCLPFLRVERTDRKRVENFLRKCLMEQNKFIRAWAYNGFYELSVQYPEYVEETRQFFAIAMRDEAPSVKSRIRNIMKNGF